MGLSYVLATEPVFFIERAGVDAWGISKADSIKQEFKGFIRGAESSTPVTSPEGKQVIPSYTVSFNGKVPFRVGDRLEIEGNVLVILAKNEIKDLSRNVMYTKVTL